MAVVRFSPPCCLKNALSLAFTEDATLHFWDSLAQIMIVSFPQSLNLWEEKKKVNIYIYISQFCLCPFKEKLNLNISLSPCLTVAECISWSVFSLELANGVVMNHPAPWECLLQELKGYDKMINSLWNDPSSPAWRLGVCGFTELDRG